MKDSCILVVDDDPTNFEVIETLLERQSYQLHYASDGESALAVLATVNPDLILLDIMMPGINGVETCKAIRSQPQWSTVPIIMVTALDNTLVLSHCLTAGANDFITKPINSIELQARVRSMLRIKQQYDDIQNLSVLQSNTISFLQGTLDELRGNLARSLSHELNTPLNGIIGTLSLLEDDLEAMEVDEIREILGWADTSVRRLESLTQKFLIYLELELQQSPDPSGDLPPMVTLPSEALTQELAAIAHKADRSGDLVCDFEMAEIPLSERYLKIALLELVDNAFKFSESGTAVSITGRKERDRFYLTVADGGRGMTTEQTQKIGAFMQFDRHLHEQQGTGIGLKIVSKIVALNGGHFRINSEQDRGTQVVLELPLTVAIAPEIVY